MWDMCEVERRNVKRNVLWQNQKPTLVTVNFINISNNYEPLQIILWSNRKKDKYSMISLIHEIQKGQTDITRE